MSLSRLALFLLLALPAGDALATPGSASTASEPALTQGRGRAGGARGGQKKKKSGKKSPQRSIAGRAPSVGGLLGAGRPVDVVPAPRTPTLEEFVQRAPRPDLGEEAYVELADEERLTEWFVTADYDESDWISYREAEQSMEFDRARFRLYDQDRDGRMSREEFDYFYTDSMRLFSSFLAPEPEPVPSKAPPRTPEQLRVAYDRDLDEALSLFELARLLNDYRRLELVPGEVLRYVDRNGDERLEVSELVDLQGYLYPITQPEDLELAAAVPTSLAELFDVVEPRGVDIGGTPYPPHIVGPTHPLRRLDHDGDGFVSSADLEELLRPIRMGIRPRAVLNTLDLDGDGKLSFEELERAFVDTDQ